MRRLRILLVAAIGLTLVAVPAAWALKVKKDPPPPTGFVGVPYTHDFEPDGGITPYSFSITSGGLPPGLRMSTDDGIVSGTPTQAGQFFFYVQVRSGSGAVSQVQFSITIEQKLTITTGSPLPDAAINTAYPPQQLAATGGTVSSWGVQSGSFPPGITLSTAGVVSGTPTASGSYEAVVLAQGGGKSDTKRIRLTVTAPLVLGGPGGAPPASEPVARNSKVGNAFSWAVLATGGSGPYTYSSTTLPAGILLAPDGKVTGTFTAAGVTETTFKVTDAKGTSDELKVRFNVKALLAFASGPAPKAGKVGASYSWKVPVTGASKTKTFLASGKYPPGLELNETTGVFSGKPLAAGSFKVKVWVLGDPGTQITKTFTIKVNL